MFAKISICLLVIFCALSSTWPLSANDEYKTSDTTEGEVIRDLLDQAILTQESDSGDNIDSVTLAPESVTDSISTMAVTSNVTTKPTWIQRIPKRKPKTSE